MPGRRALEDRVVDAALELAEERGWEGVRLYRVADRLGLSLGDVRAHYRDLDAVADAWLGRADRAMLGRRDDAGFAELAPRERLYAVITRWLDTLVGHRRVTGEIFRAKLYPGHPHHNVALVMWLSRTVQWLREAAQLDATGRRRQVEEIGLTALFVATLAVWLGDGSDNQERTRRFLNRRLAASDRLMARLWPPREGASEPRARPARPRPGRRPRAGSPPSAS
jgi:AcrR family transcriptional regulator